MRADDALPLPPARRTIALLARATVLADPLRAAATVALVIAGQCWPLVGAVAVTRVVNLAARADRADHAAMLRAAALLAAALVIRLAARPPLATTVYALRERAQGRVERRIVELSAELPGIDHLERPELLDRIVILQGNAGNIGYAIASLVEALASLAQLVVTIGLLAAVHPAALLLPVVGLVPFGAGMLKARYRQDLDDESGHHWRAKKGLRIIAWSAHNGPDLRLAGAGATVRKRQDEAVLALRRAHDRWAVKAATVQSLGDMVFGGGLVALVGFVGTRVASGTSTPGDLVLVLVLGQRLATHIGEAMGRTTSMLRLVRALSVLTWLEDEARAARRPGGGGTPPAALRDGIVLRGVSFAYPGTSRTVLSCIDLDLRPGRRIAVVGENGAGKSTLVSLLCGFHQPTEGVITVDGVPLPELDQRAWQRRTTAVFQEATRLQVEMLAAVGVGDLTGIEPAPADRVDSALDLAGLRELRAALPAGLDTRLGRHFAGGVDLSGGQWQKVAHARSTLREHALLFVLDEPTSALDAQAESNLFARVRNRPGADSGVTLFVSHRFSTVRDADEIVVLDAGRIVEHGTHDELMALAGTYAALYHRQARHYT